MSKLDRAVTKATALADRVVSEYEAGTRLYDLKGLKKIGGGHFSSVFRVEAEPGLVVKVTTGCPDEASMTYLAWARAHPGPHVPQVYYLRRGKDIQVAVLNRLYPLDTANMEAFDEYIDYLPNGIQAEFAPALVAKQIKDFFSDVASWDLHSENVMQDVNGVMVITDPITRCNDDASRALRTGIERAYGVKSD